MSLFDRNRGSGEVVSFRVSVLKSLVSTAHLLCTMPRTVIVDVSEILSVEQLREEQWTIVRLSKYLGDPDSCLHWCAQRKLLRNSVICALCNIPASLHNYKTAKDGKRWKCTVCQGVVSVRDGSCFERSRLTIQQILLIIYSWATELPQHVAAAEAETSTATVIEWFNFCKNECANWLHRNPIQVGGFDEDGQPLVVEIDESKFPRRQYFSDGHRVFGGIERRSGKCFLVELNNHTVETPEGIILKHILPGTHIVSNGWRVYSDLENLENGIYMHSVVTHGRNFVDLDDDEVHTQNMQNLWMRIKRKLRMQFGTSCDLFPKYLQEFVWRSVFRRKNIFASILVSLTESFPTE